MNSALLAVLIGLGCAAVFGYYVARRSERREKIYGGWPARMFHYIGAASIAGILPVILVCLILGQGFRSAFPIGVTFLVTGLAALLIFAVIERPARARMAIQDRGWSKEDAQKSY